MKYFSSILFLLVIVLTAAAGYYYYQQIYLQTLAEQANDRMVPPLEPSPTLTTATSAATMTNTATIPADWVKYTSTKYGFSIMHPADIKTETTSEGDRFLKLGPTQSLGTELYDGISVTIKNDELVGKKLQDVVKEKYDGYKKEETTQSLSEIQPVTYGTHSGFQFRKSSLGDADFIYLEQSPEKYIKVMNGTVEPTTREQTFAKIVNQMISSITY